MLTNSTCSTCPYRNEFGYCSLMTGCINRNITLQSEVMVLKDPDCIKVTRCKDCKHAKEWSFYRNSDRTILCALRDEATKPDWFCADGEMR